MSQNKTILDLIEKIKATGNFEMVEKIDQPEKNQIIFELHQDKEFSRGCKVKYFDPETMPRYKRWIGMPEFEGQEVLLASYMKEDWALDGKESIEQVIEHIKASGELPQEAIDYFYQFEVNEEPEMGEFESFMEMTNCEAECAEADGFDDCVKECIENEYYDFMGNYFELDGYLDHTSNRNYTEWNRRENHDFPIQTRYYLKDNWIQNGDKRLDPSKYEDIRILIKGCMYSMDFVTKLDSFFPMVKGLPYFRFVRIGDCRVTLEQFIEAVKS